MFTECIQRIEETYVELGYIHGWRFLYTAVDTLEKPGRLIFLGLNPSLPEGEETIIVPSVQRGNAFRVEQWGDRGTRLQKQVKMCFQFLATRLEQDRDQFMDATLTLNFCPFRSPGWNCLQQLNGPVEFSRALIQTICEFTRPSAIVCMGLETPYGEMKELYRGMGYNECGQNQIWNAGWGNLHCEGQRFTSGGHKLLIVGLPHLSTYGILLRANQIDAPEHLQGMFNALREQLAG